MARLFSNPRRSSDIVQRTLPSTSSSAIQPNLFSTVLLCVFAFMFVLLMTGCAQQPKIVTVKETNTVVLTSPKVYTNPTPIPKPHYTESDYKAADWKVRAQMNAELSAILYKSIAQCNADKASFRAWETKEKASAEKSNKGN